MGAFIDINSMCWELENVMKNNFNGDVTKENFEEKFRLAKEILVEDLIDSINQNKITMREEFEIM